MEVNTTSLLPYVLDLLSRQPDLCSSLDALCEQIQEVAMDDLIRPFGTLRRAVEFSVELGVNLGLLLLSDKRVRMPFNFHAKSKKKPPRAAKPNDALGEQDRRIIRQLAKALRTPRSGVIKPKTKAKARRSRAVPRNMNVNKVRRLAKKQGMNLGKTIGSTS